MARMLRIRATRTFNSYRAGDEMLVQEDAEITRDIRAGYWELVAVESPPAPSKPPAPPKQAKAKASKSKSKAKPSV